MDELLTLRAIRYIWDQRAAAVRAARDAGATWPDIAAALGVSRMTVIGLAQDAPQSGAVQISDGPV